MSLKEISVRVLLTASLHKTSDKTHFRIEDKRKSCRLEGSLSTYLCALPSQVSVNLLRRFSKLYHKLHLTMLP